MTIPLKGLVVACAMVACGSGVGRLLAQTPSQPAPARADVLDALLVEVRGLRAAMEQMASAGPRIQLSVARLQLEEGRINTMVRRLDTVRDSLGIAQRELDDRMGHQKRSETQLAQNPNMPERDEVVQVIAQARLEAVDKRALVSRLTAEEAQLTQDVTTEQTRWMEINQRLDELERALVKR